MPADPEPREGPRRGRPADSLAWSIVAGGMLIILALLSVALVSLRGERALRGEGVEQIEVGQPMLTSEGHASAARLAQPVSNGALPGVSNRLLALRAGAVRIQLSDPSVDPEAADHVRARCPGPTWVRAPGAFVIEYADEAAYLAEQLGPDQGLRQRGRARVAWYWCAGSAEREAAAIRYAEWLVWQPDVTGIWTRRTRANDLALDHRPSGMLNPAVAVTGLEHAELTGALLLGGVFVSGLIASLFGARIDDAGRTTPGDREGARGTRRAAWIGLLGLGVAAALRVGLAVTTALDNDERSWARPFDTSVFHESHDAWVHPPLFHLIQQAWVRAIAWAPGGSTLLIRLPMIVAGVLALAVVVISLRHWLTTRSRWLLVLPCVLGPTLAADMILARPYPLAALLVVLAVAAAWLETEDPWLGRGRWWLALASMGLALWTDVIAGFAAAALLVVRLATLPAPHPLAGASSARTWAARLAVIAVVVAWLAPLIPGMLLALEFQVDPTLDPAMIEQLGIAQPAEVRPDPDLTWKLPAVMVFGLASRSIAWIGLATLAVVLPPIWVWRHVGLGERWPRLVTAALPLAMVVGSIVVAATLVHLRSRNVGFAPYLVALFIARALSGGATPAAGLEPLD